MSRHIPRVLREKVAFRADFRYEYCRMPEAAALVRFQIEHILSVQHGGKATFLNLAYAACPICNSNKGLNVGTVLKMGQIEHFVRFFNPRIHAWEVHFAFENGEIFCKTAIGIGTAKILKFNEIDRILERLELIDLGAFDFFN